LVEQTKFLRRQRHQQDELKAKQAMLLSKPAEVKQIADLIILGQKVGPQTIAWQSTNIFQVILFNIFDYEWKSNL